MVENTKILLNKSDLLEVYPQKGETKSDFINRFMRVTGSEYPDVKQRQRKPLMTTYLVLERVIADSGLKNR